MDIGYIKYNSEEHHLLFLPYEGFMEYIKEKSYKRIPIIETFTPSFASDHHFYNSVSLLKAIR